MLNKCGAMGLRPQRQQGRELGQQRQRQREWSSTVRRRMAQCAAASVAAAVQSPGCLTPATAHSPQRPRRRGCFSRRIRAFGLFVAAEPA